MQMDRDEIIEKLLRECAAYPEIFNKTGNWLYKEFGIHSAELVLLITYYIIKEGSANE